MFMSHYALNSYCVVPYHLKRNPSEAEYFSAVILMCLCQKKKDEHLGTDGLQGSPQLYL